MKLLPGFVALTSLLCSLILSPETGAQNLPGSLGFSIEGDFTNGTAQSSSSILITDNDLTNGYASGFDLKDAPAALNPTGPAGSAAFQWGVASGSSAYPHSSALWFQPLNVGIIAPEQAFDLGYLFYRNGTIKTTTGATWVDLALKVNFTQPLGMSPISATFGCELLNTVNSGDQVASADIVSLGNLAAPINFTDATGNRYYLELTFKVDQDTIDGTLSTQNQFRVFEGGQGSATLIGRFTTTPVLAPGGEVIPEPSTMLLGALGMALCFRRKR